MTLRDSTYIKFERLTRYREPWILSEDEVFELAAFPKYAGLYVESMLEILYKQELRALDLGNMKSFDVYQRQRKSILNICDTYFDPFQDCYK
jgi:hypothetical protein